MERVCTFCIDARWTQVKYQLMCLEPAEWIVSDWLKQRFRWNWDSAWSMCELRDEWLCFWTENCSIWTVTKIAKIQGIWQTVWLIFLYDFQKQKSRVDNVSRIDLLWWQTGAVDSNSTRIKNLGWLLHQKFEWKYDTLARKEFLRWKLNISARWSTVSHRQEDATMASRKREKLPFERLCPSSSPDLNPSTLVCRGKYVQPFKVVTTKIWENPIKIFER